MGWRERDWARFNTHERRVFFGDDGTLPPSNAGFARRPNAAVTRRRSRRWARLATWAVVLAGAVLLAVLLQDHVGVVGSAVDASQRLGTAAQHRLSHVSLAPSSRPTALRVPRLGNSNRVVPIRWRPQDVAPARGAGWICITVARPKRRRVCAAYTRGEVPADTLARRLRELGFRVESHGG